MEINTPSFEHFPEDGKVYRIYWAGLYFPRAHATNTPRIAIWLTEESQGKPKPFVETRLILDSIGSIPRMALGSFWQDGRMIDCPLPKEEAIVDLEIAPQSQWPVFRAEDAHPSAPTSPHDKWAFCYLPPADFRLNLRESKTSTAKGHRARIVPARTASGDEVIFPCYELFRAFYAGTSELAITLLARPWNNSAAANFVSNLAVTETDGMPEWRFTLQPGTPQAAVPYLGMLLCDADARRAAQFIYPQLVVDSQQNPTDAWILATPPVLNRSMHIRAHVRKLPSRNALLVLQIIEASYPGQVGRINYFVATEARAVLPATVGTTPRAIAPGGSAAGVSITGIGDSAPTIRNRQLAAPGPVWRDLPEISKEASRLRLLPRSAGTRVERFRADRVSTGTRGQIGDPSRAGFSQQEAQELYDRFAALRSGLDALVSTGEITHWRDLPIVRPTPEHAPAYCAFPNWQGTQPIAWSTVGRPQARPRVAWLIELTTPALTAYWIESEAVTARDIHCALIFVTVDRSQPTADLVGRLLELCALARGVWPSTPSISLAADVLWVKVTHRFAEKQMRPSTLRHAIRKLGRLC